jgi:transcriptional regulator with XRE-family HTH domain
MGTSIGLVIFMSIEIGERVKLVRGELNQRDFADRLGVSKGSISQIEQGKAMPSGDFLLKIHSAFEVDITWLLTGMGNQPTTAPALRPDEAALLDNYRHSPPDQQRLLKETSAAFAQCRNMKKAN